MSPAPNGQTPAIARNSVDLPEPDGPERTTLSPSASARCYLHGTPAVWKEKINILKVTPGRAPDTGDALRPCITERFGLVDRCVKGVQAVDHRFKPSKVGIIVDEER